MSSSVFGIYATTVEYRATCIRENAPATTQKQQEVLDFVEFLAKKNHVLRPRRSLKGLWADLNVHITSEDIAQVRREM